MYGSRGESRSSGYLVFLHGQSFSSENLAKFAPVTLQSLCWGGGVDTSLQYVPVIATKDNRSIPAVPLHITTRGYHITSSHTTEGAIKEEIKNKEKKIHAFPIFFRLRGRFKRSSTSSQKYPAPHQHQSSLRITSGGCFLFLFFVFCTRFPFVFPVIIGKVTMRSYRIPFPPCLSRDDLMVDGGS